MLTEFCVFRADYITVTNRISLLLSLGSLFYAFTVQDAVWIIIYALLGTRMFVPFFVSILYLTKSFYSQCVVEGRTSVWVLW